MNLEPGQNVICKIAQTEPGGYTLSIPGFDLPGYLPSATQYDVGDEVLVTFVCIDIIANNQILFSERFTNSECSFCFRTKVKKLIICPKGKCICDECIQSFVSGLETEYTNSLDRLDDGSQKPSCCNCSLCNKTQELTDSVFAYKNELMCKDCLKHCTELLAEHRSKSNVLILSPRFSNHSIELFRCSFCPERFDRTKVFASSVAGEESEYVCRACASDCFNNKIPKASSEKCSFCHRANGEWMGKNDCQICRECLEFSFEIFRGQDVGPSFWDAALHPDLSKPEALTDSPPCLESVRCTFCNSLKKTCCELFPGSESQICHRCYQRFKTKNKTGSRSPCARCQNSKASVVGPGFTLCAVCIETLFQQINEADDTLRIQSPLVCSMCRLTGNSIAFEERVLCVVCIKRFKLILDKPRFRPKEGEFVSCRIIAAVVGGYIVYVGIGCESGFLATRARLRRGTTVSAKFVCWYQGQMMLTPSLE